MDWNQVALMALRAVVAVLLGGFVVWEREWHARETGIRTHGTASLGAGVFALISTDVTKGNNAQLIATSVVTGIGLLGAGVILRDQGNVVGLTTAASLWASPSVGLATSYGTCTLAALVSRIDFGRLALHHAPGWW